MGMDFYIFATYHLNKLFDLTEPFSSLNNEWGLTPYSVTEF